MSEALHALPLLLHTPNNSIENWSHNTDHDSLKYLKRDVKLNSPGVLSATFCSGTPDEAIIQWAREIPLSIGLNSRK